MHLIRCSCGAVHDTNAVKHIGRQYGLEGEYMDLANCPTCGSTVCVRSASRRPPPKRAARSHRAPAIE